MEQKRQNEYPFHPNADDEKLKSDSERDQNEGAATLVQLQTADIFKLDIDCFEEAFEYLRLIDLMKLGLTCKRLNQVVGYIINQNYSEQQIPVSYLYPENKRVSREKQAKYFGRYLRRIVYEDKMMKNLPKINELKRLQLIDYYVTNLAQFKLESHKEKLKKVERLDVYQHPLEGNFYDDVLAFFPNIKRLSVYYLPAIRMTPEEEFLIGNSNDWLDRKYSTLEHFECNEYNLKMEELMAFLQLNPNIRNVSINADVFEGIELSQINSNIKLNDLAILYERPVLDVGLINIGASFGQLLNKLFECDFYKRLKLYFHRCKLNQDSIDQLKSLNALVKLSLDGDIENPVSLSSLISLEELCVWRRDNITDWTDLPTNLTKLERLHILYPSSFMVDIMPFISQVKNLEKIRIIFLRDRFSRTIDLAALNKGRAKLFGACKTTIYARDVYYMETKWAQKETDLSLIRLKRVESFEWNDDFDMNTLSR